MRELTGAGERDRKLVFYSQATVETPRGAMAQSQGLKIAEAMGRVSYGTAMERRRAGAENSSVSATARIPSCESTRAINSSSTCELDGQVWDVTGVAPWGFHELDVTIVRGG